MLVGEPGNILTGEHASGRAREHVWEKHANMPVAVELIKTKILKVQNMSLTHNHLSALETIKINCHCSACDWCRMTAH